MTFLISMVGLEIFLMIIRLFIPAAGRMCFVSDFVDIIMFLDLAFLFFFCGFLLIKETSLKSVITGVFLGLLGIASLWGAADQAKVVLDIGSEPQMVMLEECQYDYRIRRLGRSTCKLIGMNNGRQYIFDVGGLDRKMLTELGENHGSATVTYYKNSMDVVYVEPKKE